MKKVVLSLVLAVAGYAPTYAVESTPAQAEPKKAEEMAVKPVAPQEKKEGGALLVALCDQCQCTTPDKKDTKEETQAQPEQQKPAPKKLLA